MQYFHKKFVSMITLSGCVLWAHSGCNAAKKTSNMILNIKTKPDQTKPNK